MEGTWDNPPVLVIFAVQEHPSRRQKKREKGGSRPGRLSGPTNLVSKEGKKRVRLLYARSMTAGIWGEKKKEGRGGRRITGQAAFPSLRKKRKKRRGERKISQLLPHLKTCSHRAPPKGERKKREKKNADALLGRGDTSEKRGKGKEEGDGKRESGCLHWRRGNLRQRRREREEKTSPPRASRRHPGTQKRKKRRERGKEVAPANEMFVSFVRSDQPERERGRRKGMDVHYLKVPGKTSYRRRKRRAASPALCL